MARIDVFEKLAVVNKLKHIQRGGKVGNRQESVAEHTWSALVLARFYLKELRKSRQKLDEKKVFLLLLYHDMTEIYTDDFKVWGGKHEAFKRKLEEKALRRLVKELPSSLAAELKKYSKEYNVAKSKEAIFCHAVDNFEAIIQNRYDKKMYVRYAITERRIRELKEKYYRPFPVLHRDFNMMITSMRKAGILELE